MDDVPAVAAQQFGVFTRSQALAEGWTRRQVARRVERGRWVRLPGGALTPAGRPRSAAVETAGVLIRWPEAVACFRTAAALQSLPVAPDGLVHVNAKRGRQAKGVRVHLGLLPREHVDAAGGLLARTVPERTVEDCLATGTLDEALDLYAWLSTRRQLDHAALVAAATARAGRPGVAQLRELAALTAGGAVSAAEHRLHLLLEAAGLTGWTANVRLVLSDGRVVVVDVVFAAVRVAIEVDGLRAHASPERFMEDRRRQNALVLDGWTVLRFTWRDLVDHPDAVVAQIRAAIASRSGHHPTRVG